MRHGLGGDTCSSQNFCYIVIDNWLIVFVLLNIQELILHILAYLLFRFAERGKIFTKQEVRAIQAGPGSIFFTGDGTGQVRVWNWIPEPTPILQ